MTNQVKIFYSYSHKDKKLCDTLREHLQPLVRAGRITHWYDREILPGDHIDNAITENLQNSDIILFLLSKDFLASDYIHEKEVKLAMEMHARGQAIVVPVMLRACDLEYTPFEELQRLPTDMAPLTSWRVRDDAYLNVVAGLKKVISRVVEMQEFSFVEEKKWKTLIETHRQNAELVSMELQIKQRQLKHISMELHDNVGQVLALVRLYLNSFTTASHSQAEEYKVKSDELLTYAMHIIRQLSHSAQEDISKNDFDLKKEMLELESAFIHHKNISLELKFEGIESIENVQLAINIFRIIQELVNNIVKHSQAKKAGISIISNKSNILITATDNGIGFTKDQKLVRGGIGLKNIQSRIGAYNGTLNIASGPDHGTAINISIPVLN